jgi:hypothetical protein
LKKGIGNKYKGKVLLIFFNRDGIDYFANKCPHKKKKRNEEDDSNTKNTYKGKRTKKKVLKKKICTKEDCSSSNEDEAGESETKIVIFIKI